MTPRQVACPVALHPDGAPPRLPVFAHPQAGTQLVKGGLRPGERAEAAAARELFEESGLETRRTLYLGQSDTIQDDATWHFCLCRIVHPARAEWAHFCADHGGHRLIFRWHAISDPLPADAHPIFHNALDWIRNTL